MAHIVTLNTPSREDWITQLANVVTSPDELLRLLNVDADEKLLAGREARRLFPLRVPRAFIARMEKGNPNDPLLRQVLTAEEEFIVAPDTPPIRWKNSTAWCPAVAQISQPGPAAGERRLRGKLSLLLPPPLPLCRKSGHQAQLADGNGLHRGASAA
jgi:hypothetical protein